MKSVMGRDSRVVGKGRGEEGKISPFIVNEGNYGSFATISNKSRIRTTTHNNSTKA